MGTEALSLEPGLEECLINQHLMDRLLPLLDRCMSQGMWQASVVPSFVSDFSLNSSLFLRKPLYIVRIS